MDGMKEEEEGEEGLGTVDAYDAARIIDSVQVPCLTMASRRYTGSEKGLVFHSLVYEPL